MSTTTPMKIRATNTGGGDNCPKGTYAATIQNIEIEENEESQFDTGPQVKITVLLRTVIHATRDVPTQDNPKPSSPESWLGKTLWAFANWPAGDLTPRMKLRQWLEAISERSLDEAEEFELGNLIGTPVIVTVGRTQTGRHKVTDFARDHALDKPADAKAPMRQEATPRQLKHIAAVAREAGMSDEEVGDLSRELFDKSLAELTRNQASQLAEAIQAEKPVSGLDDDDPNF